MLKKSIIKHDSQYVKVRTCLDYCRTLLGPYFHLQPWLPVLPSLPKSCVCDRYIVYIKAVSFPAVFLSVLPILCTIWFILDDVAIIIATLTSGTSISKNECNRCIRQRNRTYL